MDRGDHLTELQTIKCNEGSAPALRGSAARTDAPQTDRHAAEGPTADGRGEFCTKPYDRVGRDIFSIGKKMDVARWSQECSKAHACSFNAFCFERCMLIGRFK